MAVTLVTWPKFCQEYNVCLGLSHLGASRSFSVAHDRP